MKQWPSGVTAVGLALLAMTAGAQTNIDEALDRAMVEFLDQMAVETQPLPELVLSLSQAVEMACRQSPVARSIREEEEIRRGESLVLSGERLPAAQLEATYQEDDNVIIAEAPLGRQTGSGYALSVQQPVFTWGKATAAGEMAEQIRIVGNHQRAWDLGGVVYEVSQSYHAALWRRELHQVALETEQIAREHLTDVQKQRAADKAADMDVMREKVVLANHSADREEAGRLYAEALVDLACRLGVSPARRFKLTTPLEYRPGKPAEERGLRMAQGRRMDLLAAEARMVEQKHAVRHARADLYPHINAEARVGGQSVENELYSSDGLECFWSMGVSVQVPIFDRFQIRGRVVQAEARYEQSRCDYERISRVAEADVRLALMRMESAERRVESEKQNVKMAEEVLRLGRVRYQLGALKELEFNDLAGQLALARRNLQTAIYHHVLARLALQRATGELEAPASTGGTATRGASHAAGDR